jgi:hypothetical protein
MSIFSNLKQLIGDFKTIAEQEDLSLSQQVRGIFKATEAADQRREAEEAARAARKEKPSC